MKLEEIDISRIKVGKRIRRELGDIETLAKSIREIGLLNPITVREDGSSYRLLAGFRRLKACKSLGWEKIPSQVLEEGESAWRP